MTRFYKKIRIFIENQMCIDSFALKSLMIIDIETNQFVMIQFASSSVIDTQINCLRLEIHN